jgi:hypothetical protein
MHLQDVKESKRVLAAKRNVSEAKGTREGKKRRKEKREHSSKACTTQERKK